MPINNVQLLTSHRLAIRASISLVNTISQRELHRPTPCAGWDLLALLAHMTVQHRGFAAAARGRGDDPAIWNPETVSDAVAADPAGVYAAAAADVLEAFAAEGVLDRQFAIPEFGPGVQVSGDQAVGFHLVDYVVHGWDVAAALGVPFAIPTEAVDAAMPIATGVPDGDFRAAAGSPFGPALPGSESWTGLHRILGHLGRSPDWTAPPTSNVG